MQETNKPIQTFQIPVKDHESEEVLFVFKADLVAKKDHFGVVKEKWIWQTAPVPEEIFEAETQVNNLLNPEGAGPLSMSEAHKIALMATMQFQAVGSQKFHFIGDIDQFLD